MVEGDIKNCWRVQTQKVQHWLKSSRVYEHKRMTKYAKERRIPRAGRFGIKWNTSDTITWTSQNKQFLSFSACCFQFACVNARAAICVCWCECFFLLMWISCQCKLFWAWFSKLMMTWEWITFHTYKAFA